MFTSLYVSLIDGSHVPSCMLWKQLFKKITFEGDYNSSKKVPKSLGWFECFQAILSKVHKYQDLLTHINHNFIGDVCCKDIKILWVI